MAADISPLDYEDVRAVSDQLAEKVRVLSQLAGALQQENRLLHQTVTTQKRELAAQQREIQALRTQLESANLERATDVSRSAELKSHLDHLIAQVDDCLAQLGE